VFESLIGISVSTAISALHGETQRLRNEFVPKCFPKVPFTADHAIELGFLAIYIIDNMVKHPAHTSWLKYQEAVAKGYYSACAKTRSFSEEIFALVYLPRLEQYNLAIAENLVDLSRIQERQERLARSAATIGRVFAELCGHPEEKDYVLIGAGAAGMLHLSTERIFHSRLRA
jgi:hypothetical protein